MSAKPRLPGSFEDAIGRIVGELTAQGLGEALGVSKGRIYSAMDSDQVNHSMLNLYQALAADIAFYNATGEEGPLGKAFMDQFQRVTTTETHAIDLVSRIGQIGKESGEAIQRIAQSIDQNSKRGKDITRREAMEILKELADVRHVIDETDKEVRQLAGIQEAEALPADTKSKAA